MKTINRVIAVIMSLCTTYVVCSQEIGVELDKYMQEVARRGRFSGTVVVGDQDTVYLNAGYKYANIEHEIPNSPKTMFRVASVTKMVTATAVLQLQEQGLLSVDDAIDKYIDNFPRSNEITIHHLLSHTSGIPTISEIPLEMKVLPVEPEHIIAHFADYPLGFTPGKGFCYSNGNYILLAQIIERISQLKYGNFITRNIFQPSGIQGALFASYDYQIIKNAASPYVYKHAGLINGPYVHEKNAKGAADLICTAHDLYLFLKALDNGILLNETSLKAMRTLYSNEKESGYGCEITSYDEEEAIEHGGDLINGFNSLVVTLPNKKIYVALLGNIWWEIHIRNLIMKSLLAIAQGKPYEPANNIPQTVHSCALL